MAAKTRVVPGADAVRAQLARMLGSERFAKSRHLSRFLQFTVERTLGGSAESLKEYLIGVEVFGRKSSFDPRADGIVRVQAINLRSRVQAYYENEGANDPVVIRYEKGRYVPLFLDRVDATEPPAVEPAPDSLAVLPFVNMTSDPENEYFTDGLTEELISVLTNVHGLRVVARTSVFRYKGKSADVRDIGAELNARMILEGSVRKSGARLSITSQLVDAETGYEKWSRTYRIDMKDLFSVQQEIATAISRSFRDHERGSAGLHSENLKAYHSYLRGRFYLNKWSEDGLRKSIKFFQTAIDLDPTFAAAYSGLADALFMLGCYGNLDPREVMPKAREAAQKAIEFGVHAEAHVSLGTVRAVCDWDWEGAEEEFRLALQLDPGCASAYLWLGVVCLVPQGRLEEAETAIRHALDLDPLSCQVNTALGLLYFVWGRYDDAVGSFDRVLEIDPNFELAHWWLGTIYLNRDMLRKALRSLRKTEVVYRSRFYEGLILNRAKAQRVLRHISSRSQHKYISPLSVAALHVTLGASDRAIEWLRRAVCEHDPWVAWLGVDGRFDPLRNDSRFTALLRSIRVTETARLKAESKPALSVN